MKTLPVSSILLLAACGGSESVAPPPVKTGTIFFTLINCANFTTADFVVDSVTVGTESIVSGALSKGYTVPAGVRSAKARLMNPGSTSGVWTYNTRVTVPENGVVTALPHC